MNTFFLTKETLTGIPVIDEQHQEWLNHLRKVLSVAEDGESAEDVARELGFLVAYTIEHFSTEEKCMRGHHYPDLSAHSDAHAGLLQSLNDLLDMYQRQGSAREVIMGLKALMNEWFTGHLQKHDKGLARFLKENGITHI